MTLIEAAVERAEAVDGWMYPAELRWLAEQAYRSLVVIEVGVWKGRSTTAICHAAAGQVFAADHFRGSPEELDEHHAEAARDPESLYAQACGNLSSFLETGRLTLLRMDSLAAAARLQSMGVVADMVFIDGGHDAASAAADLAAFAPLVRTGGLLCGHDREWAGVNAALVEFFPTGWETGPGSLWFRRMGIPA